jgi:glycosyltransferase involved in cell wall biosynthesis
MTRERSTIILVPRGIEGKGGIERQMRYLLAAFKETRTAPQVAVLAPRGDARFPLAAFAFVSAFSRYAWAALTGSVELLHVNLSIKGSTARKFWFVLVSRVFGVPFVIHLHGSDYDRFYRRLPSPFRYGVRWMFASAARTIVLGRFWREFVIDELQVDRERVCILPNAVPPIPRAGRADGPCRIVFLGRVGARKGAPELISALASPKMRELPWVATIAGDGDHGDADLERYRAIVASKGLAGRISFPGWLSSDEARRLLSDADVFILPSHSENLPLAVLEAMAAGLPIVTTPVGSTPEILDPRTDAIFVEPGDVPALAAAIASLVSNPGRRLQLGQAAFSRYQDGYSLEAYASRILRIYAEVLRNPRSPAAGRRIATGPPPRDLKARARAPERLS